MTAVRVIVNDGLSFQLVTVLVRDYYTPLVLYVWCRPFSVRFTTNVSVMASVAKSRRPTSDSDELACDTARHWPLKTTSARPGTVRDCREEVGGRQRRRGWFVRPRRWTADRSRHRRRRRGRRRSSPAAKVYAVWSTCWDDVSAVCVSVLECRDVEKRVRRRRRRSSARSYCFRSRAMSDCNDTSTADANDIRENFCGHDICDRPSGLQCVGGFSGR